MSVMTIDADVVLAAEHYVQYGLPPGSCCTRMILGDLEGAALACHPVALEFVPATYEVVRSVVPEVARDSVEAMERWMAHRGLEGSKEPFTFAVP